MPIAESITFYMLNGMVGGIIGGIVSQTIVSLFNSMLSSDYCIRQRVLQNMDYIPPPSRHPFCI